MADDLTLKVVINAIITDALTNLRRISQTASDTSKEIEQAFSDITSDLEDELSQVAEQMKLNGATDAEIADAMQERAREFTRERLDQIGQVRKAQEDAARAAEAAKPKQPTTIPKDQLPPKPGSGEREPKPDVAALTEAIMLAKKLEQALISAGIAPSKAEKQSAVALQTFQRHLEDVGNAALKSGKSAREALQAIQSEADEMADELAKAPAALNEEAEAHDNAGQAAGRHATGMRGLYLHMVQSQRAGNFFAHTLSQLVPVGGEAGRAIAGVSQALVTLSMGGPMAMALAGFELLKVSIEAVVAGFEAEEKAAERLRHSASKAAREIRESWDALIRSMQPPHAKADEEERKIMERIVAQNRDTLREVEDMQKAHFASWKRDMEQAVLWGVSAMPKMWSALLDGKGITAAWHAPMEGVGNEWTGDIIDKRLEEVNDRTEALRKAAAQKQEAERIEARNRDQQLHADIEKAWAEHGGRLVAIEVERLQTIRKIDEEWEAGVIKQWTEFLERRNMATEKAARESYAEQLRIANEFQSRIEALQSNQQSAGERNEVERAAAKRALGVEIANTPELRDNPEEAARRLQEIDKKFNESGATISGSESLSFMRERVTLMQSSMSKMQQIEEQGQVALASLRQRYRHGDLRGQEQHYKTLVALQIAATARQKELLAFQYQQQRIAAGAAAVSAMGLAGDEYAESVQHQQTLLDLKTQEKDLGDEYDGRVALENTRHEAAVRTLREKLDVERENAEIEARLAGIAGNNEGLREQVRYQSEIRDLNKAREQTERQILEDERQGGANQEALKKQLDDINARLGIAETKHANIVTKMQQESDEAQQQSYYERQKARSDMQAQWDSRTGDPYAALAAREKQIEREQALLEQQRRINEQQYVKDGDIGRFEKTQGGLDKEQQGLDFKRDQLAMDRWLVTFEKVRSGIRTVTDSFTQMFNSALQGTLKVDEAFKQLGITLATAVVGSILDLLATQIAAAIMGNTVEAKAAGASVAMDEGKTQAHIATAAAAAASTAAFGGPWAAAGAASTTVGLLQGITQPLLAAAAALVGGGAGAVALETGGEIGKVPRYGVPARLHSGEIVFNSKNADAVREWVKGGMQSSAGNVLHLTVNASGLAGEDIERSLMREDGPFIRSIRRWQRLGKI